MALHGTWQVNPIILKMQYTINSTLGQLHHYYEMYVYPMSSSSNLEWSGAAAATAAAAADASHS